MLGFFETIRAERYTRDSKPTNHTGIRKITYMWTFFLHEGTCPVRLFPVKNLP